MFARCDDEQGPVVFALLADAPGAPEPVAVVLDFIALQRGHGDYDQLTAGLVLERLQLVGELRLLNIRQNVCIIDHTAGERGKLEVRRVGWRGAGDGQDQRRQHPHQEARQSPASSVLAEA